MLKQNRSFKLINTTRFHILLIVWNLRGLIYFTVCPSCLRTVRPDDADDGCRDPRKLSSNAKCCLQHVLSGWRMAPGRLRTGKKLSRPSLFLKALIINSLFISPFSSTPPSSVTGWFMFMIWTVVGCLLLWWREPDISRRSGTSVTPQWGSARNPG